MLLQIFYLLITTQTKFPPKHSVTPMEQCISGCQGNNPIKNTVFMYLPQGISDKAANSK
jgi:hypothetical protein